MAGSLTQLFAGVTTSPSREFIAGLFKPEQHERMVLPCVGRWAVPTVATMNGTPGTVIEASDLSLFSTLIGVTVDESLSLDQVGLTIPDKYASFVEDAEDETEYIAGTMLVLKMLTTPPSNAYLIEFRRELLASMVEYRTKLTEEMKTTADLMRGATYEVRDVREVVREVAERDSEKDFLYVNLPGYSGGYTKMYGEAEMQLWQPRLPDTEFEPEEALPTIDMLTGSKATAIAYIHHGDDQMPVKGWEKVMAITVGRDRVDYLICNQPIEDRHAVFKIGDGLPRKFPIFSEEDEITPESKIEFVVVDKHTGLHYRDLFVHRLGQTKAERFICMLIDGKIVTSCGLVLRDVILGKQAYLAEVFGISVTIDKYARLGKLFMLALTSGEFRDWCMRVFPALHMSEVKGITTASPTLNHEGKTDRGVLKLTRREKQPDGTFQLQYRGEFRDDSYEEVIRFWLERWGSISRSSSTQPQPTPKKKKKRTRASRGAQEATA